MTLAIKAAKNRKILQKINKLPLDRRFDDRVKKESHNCLLLAAFISAALYALGIQTYYKTQSKAHASEILVKSELTEKEIKQLNIPRLPVEKVHGR